MNSKTIISTILQPRHMQYELSDVPIARGLSGTIYATKDKQYILKFIDYAKHKFTQLNWVVEITVLNHMKHRKIVPLIEVVETKQGCFLVMPKLTPLDHVKTKSFKERVKEQIALDIGEALTHLHQYGIIHTDIKKKNTLISVQDKTFMSALLCDMGAVKATSVAKLLRKNVSVAKAPKYVPMIYDVPYGVSNHHQYYAAYPPCGRPPEVISKSFISFKSDVWSYGCFMTSLTNGGVGFNIDNCPAGEDWERYVDENTTGPLKPAITACLKVDVDKRPSMLQLMGSTEEFNEELDQSRETLMDVVCSLPIDTGTCQYLRGLISTWSAKAIISSDCVQFCKYLIARTVADHRTKVHFENNAYLPVIICINIGLQLFHPQVQVDLCKIYNVDSVDDDLGPEYVESVMWVFREIFHYDLFN